MDPGDLEAIPDTEWDNYLASNGVNAAYDAIAHPNAFFNQRTGRIAIQKSWADAAVEGVEAAVLEVEHEEGHKLGVALNDHPTDLPGIVKHAESVGFDSRAGTALLRLHHGPSEVQAAAKAAIAAYAATLAAPPPKQTTGSLLLADLAYAGKHFGVPLAAAVLAALTAAWQGGQLVSLHTAETVAAVTALAFVAGKFHAVMGTKTPT